MKLLEIVAHGLEEILFFRSSVAGARIINNLEPIAAVMASLAKVSPSVGTLVLDDPGMLMNKLLPTFRYLLQSCFRRRRVVIDNSLAGSRHAHDRVSTKCSYCRSVVSGLNDLIVGFLSSFLGASSRTSLLTSSVEALLASSAVALLASSAEIMLSSTTVSYASPSMSTPTFMSFVEGGSKDEGEIK